jgi:hypothetical protein
MVYKCENCGSWFIVNQDDPRVQSEDYQMLPGVSDFCPLCQADFKKYECFNLDFGLGNIISFLREVFEHCDNKDAKKQ